MSAQDLPEIESWEQFDPSLQQLIFQSYMRRADKVVAVLDASYQVKSMNRYGLRVMQIERHEVEGKAWLRYFVDKEAREVVREELERLLRTGSGEPAKCEHGLKTVGGYSGLFSWQYFLVSDQEGKARAILAVGEDVTDQKMTQQVLRRRNAILEALTLATDKFLLATPDVWEGNVLEVLQQLGEARGSERVYACKNFVMDNGQVGTYLKYEWMERGERQVFRNEKGNLRSYEELGIGRWENLLKRNEVLYDSVDRLAPEEVRGHVSGEARFIVVVPVFVGEVWWGFILFEDWEADRECSPSELEALKAVALTFGQAIGRKRIEEELQRQKATVEEQVQQRTVELQTARDQVEQGLRELEAEKARLTASIQSLSVGFVMVDQDGRVVLRNDAVGQILGDLGYDWNLDALHARLEAGVELKEVVAAVMERREVVALHEVECGTQILRLYAAPIQTGDEVIGVVLLIDDATKEKKLQRSRDEFFAVASHELRTPLSAIRGNSSVIKDYFAEKLQDDDMMAIVDDIYQSSVRLIAMVNEYLEISRMEVNQLVMKPERFEMSSLLREVVRELSVKASEKGLKLEVQVEGSEEWWVRADQGRVRQIVLNLLMNALRYTEIGGVYLKLEERDDKVAILVYDTGRGIAVDEQKWLFEKFRQFGERVYSPDTGGGTGMGLYISRMLAEGMDGRIYLQSSEVGAGSCFVVELMKG